MKKSIKSLTTPILALGFCIFLLAGCNKASTSKEEITLAELNRAVSLMSMTTTDAPRTVDDLTNFPAFKGRRLAPPPAGKKFAIDPATHQVVIVDQ